MINDYRLLMLRRLLHTAYEIATPVAIVRKDNSFEYRYDDWTEKQIKDIQDKIDNIIKTDYSDLL